MFPRISIEIGTSERTISIAGTLHETAPGEDLIDVAVTGAAAHISRMGLKHARVAAVVDDERFDLVVGADGSRYSLDPPSPRGRSHHPNRHPAGGRRASSRGSQAKNTGPKPIWPLLVAAAAIVLVLSVTVGLAVAWNQRQQLLASQPTAPVTPPPAELPIVPTTPWSTRATWTVPVKENPNRVAIAATDTSIITVTADDHLTALDPATGVTQWHSPVPAGPITTGPVLTSIDGQPVIAAVTNRALLWWPMVGAPEPAGQVALDTDEDVTFDGTTPLITGRGQLARLVLNGTPVERTIPAGAQAIRADGDTVVAVNSLGQIWSLTTDDTYVPDPKKLAGLENLDPTQTITYLGTHGQLIAIQLPQLGRSEPQIRLYTPTGDQLGEPIPGNGRTLETSPHSDWAVIGATAINTQTSDVTPLPDGWRTTHLEQQIHGRVSNQPISVDPATGTVTDQTTPEATPPIASTTEHAYYAATNNDGDPQLYAVTRAGR